MNINCSTKEAKLICHAIETLGFPTMSFYTKSSAKHLTSSDRSFVAFDAFLQPLLTSEGI